MFNLQARLQELESQAKYAQVVNRARAGMAFRDVPVNVAAQIAATRQALSDEAQIKLADETYAKAAARDPEAIRTLNALRVEKFNNYVVADANWVSGFAQVINLADDDMPVLQQSTDQEVSYSQVATEKSLHRWTPVVRQGITSVNLYTEATPELEFPITDLYQGRVATNLVEEHLRLAESAARVLENRVKLFFTASLADGGAFGDFTFTGTDYSRIVFPMEDVDIANFPTTNDLTAEGIGEDTGITGEVFKAISQYYGPWGRSFNGATCQPTGRIFVASKDAMSLLDVISMESSDGRNSAQASIIENGWVSVRFGGQTWTLVPDNTLDPDAGYCYPEPSLKPILLYRKPGLDQDMATNPTDYNLAKRNLRKRFMSVVYGAALPSTMRHALCRVKYKQASN